MKLDTPVKTTVLMRPSQLAILDTAAIEVRAQTGKHLDRSKLIDAIIEQSDVKSIALRIVSE